MSSLVQVTTSSWIGDYLNQRSVRSLMHVCAMRNQLVNILLTELHWGNISISLYIVLFLNIEISQAYEITFLGITPHFTKKLAYLLGLFYKHGLLSIPAWISNYTPSKVWDEITYLIAKFNGPPVKFENRLVISSHTSVGMWLLIHAWIKVNPCL